ncbi:hypothetical protein EDB81DRAFT_379600 [Dactylonectria macrodidyma]|uniref:Uncharacterized protein n=1 Tax=Dactylonectria macrodidyma TaxID=307937 RepID=A0A9P9JD54_9HYPO|nr:hypothetical protein EDB81DRAFT_379600 [Dactylonectria macrodidyma]
MASLRISIPINGQTEMDRQDFVLLIHSIADWRRLLNARPQRKTRVHVRSPNNSSRSNSSESHDGSGSQWVPETSRWSHSTDSTDVEHFSDYSQQDEETLNNRIDTLQILEGSKKPLPDRNYSGEYARDFQRFERQEEAQRERERMRKRRQSFTKFQGVLRSPQNSVCGWPFLHSMIVKFLEDEAARDLPPYYAGQQVFLLTIKKLDDGREMVANARNLNTCSNADLVKRMAEVEKRGWRDVLWVSNQKQEFPKMVQMHRYAKELDWGHLSMI